MLPFLSTLHEIGECDSFWKSEFEITLFVFIEVILFLHARALSLSNHNYASCMAFPQNVHIFDYVYPSVIEELLKYSALLEKLEQFIFSQTLTGKIVLHKLAQTFLKPP